MSVLLLHRPASGVRMGTGAICWYSPTLRTRDGRQQSLDPEVSGDRGHMLAHSYSTYKRWPSTGSGPRDEWGQGPYAGTLIFYLQEIAVNRLWTQRRVGTGVVCWHTNAICEGNKYLYTEYGHRGIMDRVVCWHTGSK